MYLGPGAQGSIQEKFENDSEIELQDFLQVSILCIESIKEWSAFLNIAKCTCLTDK